jgi:hypothetical protein
MQTRRFWFWVALVLPTVGVLAAVWWGRFPLGIPGEWTWNRSPPPPDFPLSLFPLGIVAALFFGLVWLGGRRMPLCTKAEAAAWLAGLVAVGFSWLWVLQEAAPPEFRLSKAAFVLFYPGSSGYFTEARYNVGDLRKFLAGYEEHMAQGDVLHIGTHPPGLIIGYRGLMQLCAASPRLRHWLEATQPESVQEAFAVIAENSRNTRRPLLPEDRCVLWLAALLMQCGTVLTVVPLYHLIRRDSSRGASWLAISLWPLVPALAVFLPKSDALFPLLGTALLCTWLTSWRRRSPAWGCAAGALLACGLFLSLALLPVACLAAAVTLWEGWLCRAEERLPQPGRRLLVCGLGAGAGFLLPVLALWLATGVNMFAVWSWNYHNHAGFYGQFARTYAKWLLVNPLEFAVAAGVPLVVAGLWALPVGPEWRKRVAGPAWAALFTAACLLFSGKNMGEAARLWMVMLPCAVWLAAPLFEEQSSAGSVSPRVWSTWRLVWSWQLAVAVAIALRIVGFHLPQ